MVAEYPSPKGSRPITEIQKTAIPFNWQKVADNYDQIKEQFDKVMR